MDFVTRNRKGNSSPLAVVTQVKYIDPSIRSTPFQQNDVFEVCFDHSQLQQDQVKQDWIGIMGGAFGVKFVAYEYEKEVRLLVLDENAPETMNIMTTPAPEREGVLHIPVGDLDGFMTGVSVSPKAPDWFVTIVKELTKRFGVNLERIPVKKSELFTGPGWN
ncbi:MAG: hypothetical protein ACLQDF_03720 [Desulfomonilia bacterium]